MTRIAIVEDEASELDALRSAITTWPDHRCVGAFRSAESLLRDLPEIRPDLVIVDLGLPRMDGIRFLYRLREIAPEITALVHTVESDSTVVFRALQAGAAGYLLKGVSVAALRQAIGDLMAGGSVMTPSIARHVLRWLRRTPTSPAGRPTLSPRERQVLALLTQGFRNDEIAIELGMSLNTVKTHVRRIYEDLHVHSRGELFAMLRQWDARTEC
ncbi:MAG: response regulator transcription factor [Verrucomicrobiales bacterium]|nr:response regulator transcription factor [Verrucomicrobiales bacterium]